MALNKILLAEDEPDIRTVAELALASVGGFTVHLCEDGAHALAELPGFAPDLVMLDVMMPNMDGPTTLAELRKLPQGKDVPVIFMTAKVQQAEIEGYKRLGAIGVIPKPFDPMTLADKVRELWSAAGK
ncbi:MAG: response regulator [Rhodocyclaceae bacterium]|nr:response regulator [Rhodocyclaceae bacterium]